MVYLYTILTTLALAQVPGEETHWVSLDRREGKCLLRDFGGRPDGRLNGVRTWFGREVLLTCSFYVSSEEFWERNTLIAGGMFYGEHPPLYYCYNVAFFDAEENLIACDGGDLPDHPLVTSRLSSVTRTMPIPRGVHKCVDSYRVAYYESDVAIGKVAWDEHESFRVTSTNGNTGETTERSWPLWKSDGEMRGSSFPVRAGSRPLPIAAKEDWQAETTEGTCRLKRTATSDSGEEQGQRFLVAVGEKLRLKAHCRFNVSRDSAIETWVSFKNTSDKKTFGELYIAFFDKYGNLVGSTRTSDATEPGGTNPSVTVGGKPQPTAIAFQAIKPMPIPRGFEEKVTSYKITMYVSGKPIGENTGRENQGRAGSPLKTLNLMEMCSVSWRPPLLQ